MFHMEQGSLHCFTTAPATHSHIGTKKNDNSKVILKKVFLNVCLHVQQPYASNYDQLSESKVKVKHFNYTCIYPCDLCGQKYRQGLKELSVAYSSVSEILQCICKLAWNQ